MRPPAMSRGAGSGTCVAPGHPRRCVRPSRVMADNLTSRDAVMKAVAEYDRVGKQSFLDTYGFRPSTRYELAIGDRTYVSKAIVGVAYGYEHPGEGPLSAGSFSGGIDPGNAAWQLQRLGFNIVEITGS